MRLLSKLRTRKAMRAQRETAEAMADAIAAGDPDAADRLRDEYLRAHPGLRVVRDEAGDG